MAKRKVVELAFLQSRISYDPVTGKLYWLKRPLSMFSDKRNQLNACNAWNAKFAGKECGSITSNGYIDVSISGMGRIKAHRVCWGLYYGSLPELDVDHIDGNTLNNSIENLRLATKNENAWNSKMQRNNACGLKGAHFCKTGKRWRATICVNRQHHHLGLFDTPEEAHAAYCEAAARLHGEFARVA